MKRVNELRRKGVMDLSGVGVWSIPLRFGDPVEAAEARRLGVISRVVPHDQLRDGAGR